MLRRSLSRAAVLAVPVAALAIAGCGGGGTSSAASAPQTGGGQVLRLSANPSGQLEFSPTSLSAKAGKVTLVMTNPSSSGEEHGIAVEGNGVDQDGPVVAPGGTSTLTVTLKRGTYEFYCPFDHHAQDGMTGKLTVR
jgi:uncharacterized cupredoxin-like copper-binding protein